MRSLTEGIFRRSVSRKQRVALYRKGTFPRNLPPRRRQLAGGGKRGIIDKGSEHD